VRPIVLVVAGFDPSGGAGVLRDCAAIEQAGAQAVAAITSVTFQDGGRFDGYVALPADVVMGQVESATRLKPPAAVKVGMLGSRENVDVIADFLARTGLQAVVDPLFKASAGAPLIDDVGYGCLKERLLPLATVLTPNVPEAERLLGRAITSVAAMGEAAVELCRLGPGWVVVKGGHMGGAMAVDCLADRHGNRVEVARPRLAGKVHGSGCIFSSTLAARLASGLLVEDAVRLAQEAVASAIRWAGLA